MLFTRAQLENIAAWKPADESFASIDPIEQYIRPAICTLAESYECHIVDDGGLSNYYSVAIHPSLTKQESSLARHYKPYEGNGALIYLSLMAPVGAIGRTSITVASDMFGASPLSMESLIDPERGIDETVDAILDAFNGSIYRFLDRHTLAQQLPPHITPDEYCLCDEPWDRVFHALFANTD
jgi:hypothetical protein